ncbi:MAG: hypothetical protein IK104_05240 [Clostridia bacterium]|nr:hypothetical protein [Clostridia bacterium]
MLLRFGRLRLRITFLFTAFLTLALASPFPTAAAAFLLGAAAHETGHLVCLMKAGKGEYTLRLTPGGAAIAGAGTSSLPLKQALVAVLAGPAVNLALAAGLFAVGKGTGLPLEEAAAVNLGLGLVNLIPFSFFDGGRALTLLSVKAGRTGFLTHGQPVLDALLCVLLLAAAFSLTLTGAPSPSLWCLSVYVTVHRFARRR